MNPETSSIMSIQDQLFTKKDLAHLFKLTPKTIDRLVATGQFPPPLHIGHSCRWRPADLHNYLLSV